MEINNSITKTKGKANVNNVDTKITKDIYNRVISSTTTFEKTIGNLKGKISNTVETTPSVGAGIDIAPGWNISLGVSTTHNSNYLDSDTSIEFSYDIGKGLSNGTSLGIKPQLSIDAAKVGPVILMIYLVPTSVLSSHH